MTDITIVIVSAEAALAEIAKQASTLATGLQNVAPGDKTNSPNKSVQYLVETSDRLLELSMKCKALRPSNEAKR